MCVCVCVCERERKLENCCVAGLSLESEMLYAPFSATVLRIPFLLLLRPFFLSFSSAQFSLGGYSGRLIWMSPDQPQEREN